MPKILGIYNIALNEWHKLIYVHTNAAGETFVNGERARIVVHPAGEDFPHDADYAVVIPKGITIPEERYLTVNDGESMLWLDHGVSVVNSGFISVSANFEFWRRMRVGVLTVSDKGAAGERMDTAGPALADLVEALGGAVIHQEIVPDDKAKIVEKIKAWSDVERLHLVLTTGGTGMSKRDVTPEALLEIHERLAPGFGEAMRARSMLYTNRGFLTRSLAVTRGETLIISFPGSERAVRQCFEAIAPALRHGVETLAGWDAECGNHRH